MKSAGVFTNAMLLVPRNLPPNHPKGTIRRKKRVRYSALTAADLPTTYLDFDFLITHVIGFFFI